MPMPIMDMPGRMPDDLAEEGDNKNNETRKAK